MDQKKWDESFRFPLNFNAVEIDTISLCKSIPYNNIIVLFMRN